MLTVNSDRFTQPVISDPTPSAAPFALDGLQGSLPPLNSMGLVETTPEDLGAAMANYGPLQDYSPLQDAGGSLLVAESLIAEPLVQLSPSNQFFYPLFTDNTLAGANDLDTLTGLKTRTGFVGSSDTVDYYRFELSNIRDVTLSLTGLSSDVDLQLIEDKNRNGQVDSGEILASSSRSGTLNDSINKVLDSGTYFAAVKRASGDSNYTLSSLALLPQVTVDLSRVKALSSGIDFGSGADFYSKITIDGPTKTTGTVSNDNDISPNWSYSRTVSGNSRYVNIGIQMYDADGGLAGADDRVDIDPGAGRDINVVYDLLTNQITGDVSGTGGYTLSSSGNSGDRAQTWFKVFEGDWYDRNMGDSSLENIARTLSYDGISRNDMIEVLRETKDYGSVTSTELTGLRNYVDTFYMPEYVENLARKVVYSDPANSRSGIGNLSSGSSDTKMESLIGKWFLGSDRPTAVSYNRGSSYTYREVSGSLFRNGISVNDINQGNVGDCYFVAGLGAAASEKPSIIQNMFTDNGDGTFTVKFYKPNGSRDYVTVDRFLPTNGSGRAAFAGWGGGHYSSSNNELWVALAEKAYAQLNESGWIGQDNTNSYNGTSTLATPIPADRSNSAGINGGSAAAGIQHVSGLDTTTKDFNNMTKTQLINLLNSSKMVNIDTDNVAKYGAVTSHVYVLTSYNSSTGKFHLHNPWGSSHVDLTWDQMKELGVNATWSAS